MLRVLLLYLEDNKAGTNLNFRRPARPLVVSSSGNSSNGWVPSVEQYLWRDSPIAARPDAEWTSMKPLAQHTKPVEPSNCGWKAWKKHKDGIYCSILKKCSYRNTWSKKNVKTLYTGENIWCFLQTSTPLIAYPDIHSHFWRRKRDFSSFKCVFRTIMCKFQNLSNAVDT